jgi:hypothetical protein
MAEGHWKELKRGNLFSVGTKKMNEKADSCFKREKLLSFHEK